MQPLIEQFIRERMSNGVFRTTTERYLFINFVHVAESDAASARHTRAESHRAISPISPALAYPNMCTVAEPRKSAKIDKTIPIYVGKDGRAFPNAISRQTVGHQAPVQFRTKETEASSALTTKDQRQ